MARGKNPLTIGDSVQIDRSIKGVGGMVGVIIRTSSHPDFDFVVRLGEGNQSASFRKSELFRVHPK